MSLRRTSTYNLACDFKDQIEEVEMNWDADLQRLQKAKKTREALQEKLRVMHILVRVFYSTDVSRPLKFAQLEYERDTTANMEQTLKEKKAEVGILDFDNSNLSDTGRGGSSSLSSASVYSETDLCLTFDPSAVPNLSPADNTPSIPGDANDCDRPRSPLGLSPAPPDAPPKASRSAHWKQLVASFLSHPHSIRTSPGTRARLPSSALGALTESNINIESARRRLTFHTSSLRSRNGTKDREAMSDTVNAAGGKFGQKQSRSMKKFGTGGRAHA